MVSTHPPIEKQQRLQFHIDCRSQVIPLSSNRSNQLEVLSKVKIFLLVKMLEIMIDEKS